MQFPKTPRYKKATKAACDFLIQENIRSFPLDPLEIIKRNKWGLITYSELAEEYNLPFREIVKACGSEDAQVMYDGINHTIAYNDRIAVANRIRFSLMHEIGHIYLNHLLDFNETQMNRNGLSDSKYLVLEKETNHFARNALAPATIVFRLNIKSTNEIIQYFQLTKLAAQTRVQSLAGDAIKAAMYTIDLWKHFEDYINTTTNSQHCLQCGHSFSGPSVKHCPICGDIQFSVGKGERSMIYDGYKLDENGRAHRCPICDNQEVNSGEYCKVCGVHLVNKCENREFDRDGYLVSECNTIAEGNARHCTKCGHETSFLKNKLLDRWDKAMEKIKSSYELPF